MRIERKFGSLNKNTFLIKPITKLLYEEVKGGKWLDPFANCNTSKRLFPTLDITTNDLNPEFKTDYNLDALDFLKLFESNSIDGVLYDPPYSVRQVSECYKGVGMKVTSEMTRCSFWSDTKKEINRILKTNGKMIHLGWNSNSMGNKRDYTVKRVLLVWHGSHHNDTIVTVSVREQASLFDF